MALSSDKNGYLEDMAVPYAPDPPEVVAEQETRLVDVQRPSRAVRFAPPRTMAASSPPNKPSSILKPPREPDRVARMDTRRIAASGAKTDGLHDGENKSSASASKMAATTTGCTMDVYRSKGEEPPTRLLQAEYHDRASGSRASMNGKMSEGHTGGNGYDEEACGEEGPDIWYGDDDDDDDDDEIWESEWRKRRSKYGESDEDMDASHNFVLIFLCGVVLGSVFSVLGFAPLCSWRGDNRSKRWYIYGAICGLAVFVVGIVATVFVLLSLDP